jgi:hypothetical protein
VIADTFRSLALVPGYGASFRPAFDHDDEGKVEMIASVDTFSVSTRRKADTYEQGMLEHKGIRIAAPLEEAV